MKRKAAAATTTRQQQDKLQGRHGTGRGKKFLAEFEIHFKANLCGTKAGAESSWEEAANKAFKVGRARLMCVSLSHSHLPSLSLTSTVCVAGKLLEKLQGANSSVKM